MKTLLIISTIFLCSCKITYHYSANLKEADIKEMDSLYLQGLKSIRHDALCRLNFGYAHDLKKEIKTLTNKK